MRIAAKRLLGAVPSLAGVMIVTFLLSHALPGDPAVLFAGPAANAESVAQVRAHLGLDRRLPVQLLAYVRDLVHGDLGQSLTTGQPVLADLVQRLPASMAHLFGTDAQLIEMPQLARLACRTVRTGSLRLMPAM